MLGNWYLSMGRSGEFSPSIPNHFNTYLTEHPAFELSNASDLSILHVQSGKSSISCGRKRAYDAEQLTLALSICYTTPFRQTGR